MLLVPTFHKGHLEAAVRDVAGAEDEGIREKTCLTLNLEDGEKTIPHNLLILIMIKSIKVVTFK